MAGECACDCGLLGREPVRGGANADGLAALVRLVTRRARAAACRRYKLRCSKEGLELRAARRQEDEGFESDDDAVSQASSDSAGSSCGDRPPPPPGQPASSADSANGSGASDDDDPRATKKRDDSRARELHAFDDVAFCHTDPAFPRVLVLVIKRKQGDADRPPGLEAVIFQCKSAESVREVCASYKEFSRRLKMDLRFRHPHRRKEAENADTLYRNAVNDLRRANAGAPPADPPFLETRIARAEEADRRAADGGKYSLVQRTDGDGVTHIEVSESALGGYVDSLRAADEYSGSSSIISISTPDVGNLIEGVIRADVDSGHADRPRQKGEDAKSAEAPPQRPQRGVKKSARRSEPRETEAKSKPAAKEPAKPGAGAGTRELVVRGQFVRVNVEQRPAQAARAGPRLFGGDLRPGALLSYPAWSEPRQRPSRSRREDRGGRGERRSRSGGPPVRRDRPEPPPAHTRPLSDRLFGKLKEIANMNGPYVPALARRRNSSGDLAATARFYQCLEPPLDSARGSNLKSVIRRKNCSDNVEPKKVTFSAYATVQVVD